MSGHMKVKETFKVEGTLKIEKISLDGSRVCIYEEENILTLLTKQNLLAMIYTIGLTSDPINSLHVGTGGCIDPQGLFPKLEDQTQTNLITPLTNVSASFTVNSSVPSVTFLADLDAGTGNGNLITEAGLFTVSGAMFNVKNFPGIPKTSEFSLHLEWTIKFA